MTNEMSPTNVFLHESPQCPDCGASKGQAHSASCDVQRCTVCGAQRLGCDHEGHDEQAAAWDGLWPGTRTCLANRWFVRFDAQHGHLPADPADVDAMPDFNREAYFAQTGVDPGPNCARLQHRGP